MNFNQVYGKLLGSGAVETHLHNMTLYNRQPSGSHTLADQLVFCQQLLGLCQALYHKRKEVLAVHVAPRFLLNTEEETDCHWLALVFHANQLAEQCIKELQAEFQLTEQALPTELYTSQFALETLTGKVPLLRSIVGVLYVVKKEATVCVWVARLQKAIFAQLERRYLTIRIITLWRMVRARLPLQMDGPEVQLHPRERYKEAADLLMTCHELSKASGWLGKAFGRYAEVEAYVCMGIYATRKVLPAVSQAMYVKAKALGYTQDLLCDSKVVTPKFETEEVQKHKPVALPNCLEKGEPPVRFF